MFERLFAKNGLSLDRMRVLLEVRAVGSIVKAAGDDPHRQSQYSRQLKELGEYFGTELTERKGRGIALTPAGEELAILIKEHFEALGNFSRRIEDEPVPVFVGAGESFIQWLLIPAAHKLQQAVPDITLRFTNLTSLDIAEKLLTRDLDFGVLRRAAVPPTLEQHVLGRGNFSLYVPKKLLTCDDGKRDKSLLARLPMAIMPGEAAFARQFFQLAEKQGIRLNTQLECDSFTAMASAVQTGHYAAVLPDHARPSLDGTIERIPIPMLKSLATEISLAWLKRKVGLRPEMDKVRAWLVKNVRLAVS